MYIQAGTWGVANICCMHLVMQSPHKTRTALVVFCTLIFLSSPAEVAQISLCPTGYGKVEWNNCLGVYYFPDGTKYVGQFRENKFHGWGAIVWHRKGVCLGCFKSGALVGRCLFPPSKTKEDRLMRTEISSQEEFERIRSKFDYSEYRKFSEAYFFNSRCKIKRTELDIDAAFPGRLTQRKKIMMGIQTGITVGLMNGKAKTISKGAEVDADIFMALKKSFVVLERPKPR